MFSDRSRYARIATVETRGADGRPVTALVLRRLPPSDGDPHVVVQGERLDLLAEQQFADGTLFWRIADANSALDAADLVAVTGDTLLLPGT